MIYCDKTDPVRNVTSETTMLKGAIFDFDGTLYDSMYVWRRADSDFLHSLGYEMTDRASKRMKTMSLPQACEFLRDEYDLQMTIPEIIDRFNKVVENAYFYDVLPKPGIPEFLEEMKNRGIRMGIATATDRYQIEAALKRCGLEHYFCDIRTCSEVGQGKDVPDIFRQSLAALGTDRDNTIVFEDSGHAMQTAKADGFTVAGVYDRYNRHHDLVKETADYYFTDYADTSPFWEYVTKWTRSKMIQCDKTDPVQNATSGEKP